MTANIRGWLILSIMYFCTFALFYLYKNLSLTFMVVVDVAGYQAMWRACPGPDFYIGRARGRCWECRSNYCKSATGTCLLCRIVLLYRWLGTGLKCLLHPGASPLSRWWPAKIRKATSMSLSTCPCGDRIDIFTKTQWICDPKGKEAVSGQNEHVC